MAAWVFSSSVDYDAHWAILSKSRLAEQLPNDNRVGQVATRPLQDLEALRREAIEACSISFDVDSEDAERCQGLRDQISRETALDDLRREAIEVCSINFDDGSIEAERCLSLRGEVSRIVQER